MGDDSGGDAEQALEGVDLGAASLDAKLGVEVGEGLVHQEDGRLPDDRAAHRHALTLTTGEVFAVAFGAGTVRDEPWARLR